MPTASSNYKFTYEEGWGHGRYYRRVERVIGNGRNPTPAHYFAWNDPGRTGLIYGTYPAARDDVFVTLTITDARGGTASTTHRVDFAQSTSKQPDDRCPPRSKENGLFVAPPPSNVKLSGQAAAVSTTCKSRMACAGSLVVTRVAARSATAAAAKRKRGQVVLAHARYVISAGQRATVRAPLTKAARRLLRNERRLRAKVWLVSVSPDGKAVVRSRTVTLKHKRGRDG